MLRHFSLASHRASCTSARSSLFNYMYIIMRVTERHKMHVDMHLGNDDMQNSIMNNQF